jgi:hypothetical protein
MGGRKRSGGLTKLELLVLAVGLAGFCVMLLPGLQAARERARSQACRWNLKCLGEAVCQYVDSNRRFPSSSGVTRNADGSIAAVDGWSWLVLLLPYGQQAESGDQSAATQLYDRLDLDEGRPLVDPPGHRGTPHADAMQTRLPGLLCPSFQGTPYADPTTKQAAITNYKTLGATHAESLSVASPQPLTPKYLAGVDGDKGIHGPVHPDGVSFPGSGIDFNGTPKGTSNTLLAVESVEQQFARWMVGAEAAVVGLPPNVEFERSGRWIVPKGHDQALHDGTGVYWTYRTYLNWDCEQRPYDNADGTQGGKHGPSSHHPRLVNHLFADGSCAGIRKVCDVTLYLHLTMRHNGYLTFGQARDE